MNTFRQPSLTEPKLSPEPYRLRSPSIVVPTNPSQNGSTTYNTLHQDGAETIVPALTEAPASSSTFSSVEQQDDDLESGHEGNADGTANGGRFSRQRQFSDDDIDDEQLDLCVNDILEGLSSTEEVPH